MKNINIVSREELLKSLTEKEADELIALIVEKKGRLTKDDFLRESQLSKTKATGLTKQFEFYKLDSDVAIKMESQTEQVEKPIEVEEQVLRPSEGKQAKAKAQAKDLKMDMVVEKVRLVLEDYFREDLENVEKLCKENHDMQTKSIERQSKSLQKVEEKINEVSKSVESLKKDASGLVKASAQQAAKEIDIKKEEFDRAVDSLRLEVRTDMNILKQEKKEWLKDIEQRQEEISDKRQLEELDKKVQGLKESVVQVENKVTEVEVKQDNATLSYIDTTHSDQQFNTLATELQTLQRSHQGLRGELDSLQRDVNQMEFDQRPHQGSTRNRQRDPEDTGRNIIRQLPKLPYYDGQSSWKTFMNTFELYSAASGWNHQDRFNAIQLCMRNKAVDFLRSQQKMGKCETYQTLVQRMEQRFERKLDPFFRRSEFFSLSQAHDEAIDEWADRVLQVGIEAFETLPDATREEELVRKFTMGSIDKDAAQFVINRRPATLEDAIALMRGHQDNATLLFGKKKIRALEVETLDERYVRAMNMPSRDERTNKVHFESSPKRFTRDDKPSSGEKIVTALEDGFDRVLRKLDDQFKEQRKVLQDNKPRGRIGNCFYCGSEEHWANKCPDKMRSRSGSRERNACFSCGDSGHFIKDCPKNKQAGWKNSPASSPGTARKSEN